MRGGRLLILVAATLALSAGPALGATVDVHVGYNNQNQFYMQSVTIVKGDTIHWVWDSAPPQPYGHSVTSGTNGVSDGGFDSGLLNTGATFDHTFSSAGTFHYFCKLHYALGMTGTITVLANETPPTASFTVHPAALAPGQTATFDASASGDTDGDTITSYQWDFGDGVTQTTPDPTVAHTFAQAMAYSVKLTVVDSRGISSSQVMQTVTVSTPPADSPSAAFTVVPVSPVAGRLAHFDASTSSDSDGDPITSFVWMFGDGTTTTSPTALVTHRYARAGTVNVELVVVDSRGNRSSPVRQSLVVRPAPPVLGALHLSKTTFCARKTRRCRHPGTRVTFTLSRAAPLSLTITHRGHVVRRLSLRGHAGKNVLAFGGAGLAPGRYILMLAPTGGSGARAGFVVAGG
jgi:plastocyanin